MAHLHSVVALGTTYKALVLSARILSRPFVRPQSCIVALLYLTSYRTFSGAAGAREAWAFEESTRMLLAVCVRRTGNVAAYSSARVPVTW